MNRIVVVGITALVSSAAVAQSIKPHPLGATQATSKETLGLVTLARQLPNGSIIVNDATRRRLLLIDSTLQGFAVIADSTSGAVNGYGQRPGALIPYVADSTLYLDATAGSLLVIDPRGQVTRVMSPPRPSDNNILASTATGFPGFDAKGRLVYRSAYPRLLQQMRDGGIQSAPAPDSAPIIRVDLDTRKADTVGALKLPRMISSTMTLPNGGTATVNVAAPLPTIDDWALLSDGSIAMLRGRDYHIDWILPDGTRQSTARIPFDWKRLTDDDKLALVDSITKARANMQAGGPGSGGPQMVSFGDGGGMRVVVGGAAGRGGDPVTDRAMVAGAQAVASAPGAASSSGGSSSVSSSSAPTSGSQGKTVDAGAAKSAGQSSSSNSAISGAVSADRAVGEKIASVAGLQGMPALPAPAASDLPDYMPPFANSSARPDADGHLWVRTTTAGMAPGSVVYDVINAKGELTDRVEVPRGMSIVGFGRGGVVFLTRRDTDGLHLVRAGIR